MELSSFIHGNKSRSLLSNKRRAALDHLNKAIAAPIDVPQFLVALVPFQGLGGWLFDPRMFDPKHLILSASNGCSAFDA